MTFKGVLSVILATFTGVVILFTASYAIRLYKEYSYYKLIEEAKRHELDVLKKSSKKELTPQDEQALHCALSFNC